MAKRIPNLAEFDTLLPESLQGKVKLTDKVQWVKPDTLIPNSHNKDLFAHESEEYFQRLREDVRERGILVPLIAKEDGTLLAGHNRLHIAKELDLKVVPVQYVQSVLNTAQEQEFIIKDNLYRRQLSQAERISLYKKIFPDFEETFLTDSSPQKGRTRKNESRLTIKKIAETTGQKVSAVKMQVTRAREEQSRQNGHNVTKNTQTKIVSPRNGHNVTIQEIHRSLQGAKTLIASMTQAERAQTRKYVEQLLKLL